MSRKYFRDELRRTLALYALAPICLFLLVFCLLAALFWHSSVENWNVSARTELADAMTAAAENCSVALTDAAADFDPQKITSDPEMLRRVSARLYQTALLYPRQGRPVFFLLDKNLKPLASSSTRRFDLYAAGAESWGVTPRVMLSHGRPVCDFSGGSMAVGLSVMKKGEAAGYLLFVIPPEWFERYLDSPNVSLLVTDTFDYVRASAGGLYRDDQGKLAASVRNAAHRYVFAKGGAWFITSQPVLGGAATVWAVTPLRSILSAVLLWAGVVLAALLAVAAGIFIGTARIAERKTKIIDELVRAFENVMHGDLGTRLNITSGDEFELMADAYNVMLDSLRDLMAKNREEAQRTVLSEIKQLESQFNPHFLFNTLENVRAMIAIDPQSARRMIVELSALLRYSIKEGGASTTLAEDLAITEKYLRIQKYRFGDKLSYGIRTEPGTEETVVPKLMLQPLIENSIQHSFRAKDSLTVSVTAKKSGGRLVIAVEDNGDGIEPGKLGELQAMIANGVNETMHIGIFNIARRIQLMYGSEYGLSIDSAEGRGTTVTLSLPASAEAAE